MPHSIAETFISRFLMYAKRLYLGSILTVILMLMGVGLGVATFYTFANSQPFDGSSKHTLVLLNLDLAVLLVFSLIVAYRLMKFRQRRKSGAASRLHARLVRWFGMMLVTPAIIITLFSATFFNLGIESWFSKHVQNALQKSTSVAEAYLNEHNKNIASEAISLADGLARKVLISNPAMLNGFLNEQAHLRSLDEALVFNTSGTVLAQTHLTFTLASQLDHISPMDLQKARDHVVVFQNEPQNRVRALIQVDPNLDIFLIVGRYVDPKVLDHISETHTAVSEYGRLEQHRGDIEIRFILIFIVFSFILLLFVIGVGMTFATRLARPITDLIGAAERIRAGDLSARVDERPDDDELGLLSRTFNRMTTELEVQRKKLIEANIQIDRRRHFIEMVLAGVSAGVIGLDAKLAVNVANKSAINLLGIASEEVIGKSLKDLIPEMLDLVEQARTGLVQSQLQVTREDKTHTLLVHIAVERENDFIVGFIITFDDITLLVNAQRKAAWSDVARRIAHEIKNPLTPIQLSAERLKKRYLSQITKDQDTFQRYIDTISRQVSYIGEMVREFSEFAKMPEAVLKGQSINELCEEALFLQKTAHPEIMFSLDVSQDQNYLYCDTSQIAQILTNLIQNAIDSIQDKQQHNPNFTGKIEIFIQSSSDQVIVCVDDNGGGFPAENREYLLEPYVTEREKGTGLGLAIVKRIMEAHSGNLYLEETPLGGGRVKLVFPKGSPDSLVIDRGVRPQLAKTVVNI